MLAPNQEVTAASSRTESKCGPRQPLLWGATAFALGIVAGTYVWRPPAWWAIALLLFAAVAGYFLKRRPRIAQVTTLLAIVSAGALLAELRPPADPGWEILNLADGREVTVTAHVTREGLIHDAGFGGMRQTIETESEEITSEGVAVPIRAGIRVNVYGKEQPDTPLRLFAYGERLRFSTKLYAPRNYRNSGAFDYRGYLAGRGIAALASTKADEVEVLQGFAGSQLELWRTKVHRSIISKIHQVWAPEEAALVDAMVIGDDAFIARDTRTDFQRSGTYHILVVSGMNVGILAFVTFWVLRRMRIGDIVASLIVVLLSIAYAVLTDVGPPIWRATLMLSIYLGTRLLYRQRSMLNAIGAAALGVLIYDPGALFGASFQLTFLAVLIIGGIAVPILERTSQPYLRGLRNLDSADYDITREPQVAQFRLDLRMVAGRLARFMGGRASLQLLSWIARVVLSAFEVAAVSALMQVGLMLPMAFYFHRATIVGLPGNLVVVPLTGILMPAAVSAVGLAYVWSGFAKIPAMVAAICLEIMNGTIQWLGKLSVADLRVATPELWVIVAAGMALVIAIAVARMRAVFAGIGVALLAASAVWIAIVRPHPQLRSGVLEVTAIDVGQGDSTFLVSPQGKTLLIDAGGPLGGQRAEFDVGEGVVSPFLWSRRISRLDAVMVTHAHSDHIGGMFAVLKNFRPKEMWIGPIPQSAAFAELLNEARQLGIEVIQRWAGDRFGFDGIEGQVFSPPLEWVAGPEPKNNDSLVVRFAYGKTAVLIEGDAERQMERAFSGVLPPAALLKIAHNGSTTSTSPELLQAVQPQFAFISVGARNTFGHPRREVLARLAEADVAVYRTDLDGAVSFYLDGSRVIPRTYP